MATPGLTEERPGVWKSRGYSRILQKQVTTRFYTDSPREAIRLRAAWLIDINSPDKIAEAARPLVLTDGSQTVLEAVEEYVRHHTIHVRPNTKKWYASYTLFFSRDPIATMRVSEVHHLAAEALLTRMFEKGYSRRTVKGVRQVATRAFRRLIIGGVLDKNPFELTELPKQQAKPKKKAPTPEQVAESVAAVTKLDADAGAMVEVFAASGARRQEVAALRRNDVDWTTGHVRFDEVAIVVTGIGAVIEDTMKTADSARNPQLDADTLRSLRALIRRQDERALAVGIRLASEAFVFSPVVDCSRPFRVDAITRKFERLKTQTGTTGPLNPHAFRHYAVTQLLAAGMAMSLVMERHGHTDLKTVQGYMHEVKHDQTAAAELLGALKRRGVVSEAAGT